MSAEADAKAAAVLEQLQRIGAKVFFEKQLTSSDSASGRVVVPKAVAENFFPKLDNSDSTGIPFDVEDVTGKIYTLRWRFWSNNTSRMYLLEQTADLQATYDMKMGDVLTFAQKDDKTVVLAARPATSADAARRQARKPSPAPAGAKGGGAGGGQAKKAVQDRSQRAALRRHALTPQDIEAPADGVFRAAPSDGLADAPDAVTEVRQGRWLASLNLSGELYQAFFESEQEAGEALALAGFVQPMVA